MITTKDKRFIATIIFCIFVWLLGINIWTVQKNPEILSDIANDFKSIFKSKTEKLYDQYAQLYKECMTPIIFSMPQEKLLYQSEKEQDKNWVDSTKCKAMKKKLWEYQVQAANLDNYQDTLIWASWGQYENHLSLENIDGITDMQLLEKYVYPVVEIAKKHKDKKLPIQGKNKIQSVFSGKYPGLILIANKDKLMKEKITHEDFTKSYFVATELTGKNMLSYFQGLDFTDSNFEKASLHKLHIKSCIFNNVDFSNAILEGVQAYDDTEMKYTKFQNANIQFSFFNKTDLRGADFSNSMIYESYFNLSNLQGANFKKVLFGEMQSKLLPPLKGALYNSRNLNEEDGIFRENNLSPKQYKTIKNYCISKIDMNFPDKLKSFANFPKECVTTIEKALNTNSGIETKQTIFPEGFNPKDYGMINMVEIYKILQRN